MRNFSSTCIRNAVLARLNDAVSVLEYECVASKLTFSDQRFAILPVSCVARDVVKSQPSIKTDLSDLQFEHCVFLILQSLISFRRKLNDLEIPLVKMRLLSKLFEEDLVTPFSGFILQKDESGRFIRLRSQFASDELSSRAVDQKKRKRSQEVNVPARPDQLLQEQRNSIKKLEKELKDTNKSYAATVEENDALLDELETARASIKVLARNNDRERKSLRSQLGQYEGTIAMLQFEIAQTAEKAPETQALLVELSRDRDRARAEAKSSRIHLEEYDGYMNCKLKEFKRVARLLVGDGRVSEEAICAVSKAVKGDVFASRASEWAKEKEKLLGYIQDKEETESVIEAQGMMCLCQRNVKRCKLVCGHSLCTQCVDKVETCPYCRTKCEISRIFEP